MKNILPPSVCQSDSPINLSGEETPTGPIGGVFSGNGVSNNIFTPKNAPEGINTLTYNVVNPPNYSTCNATTQVKVMVLPATKYINRVISATANPNTDNWPVDFSQAEATGNTTNLVTNQFFNTGSKGVWRGEESYVYVDDRKQRTATPTNPNVNISRDGTYDSLPLYLYNNGSMGGCYPGWRKMNTITRYNPFSYEIENQDILGRYSSALYGYNGNLSVAVAANAAENEIAYNGFEEYTSGHTPTPADMASGNLTLFGGGNYSGQLYREYQVISATDNTLTVNATPNQITRIATSTNSNNPLNVFGSGMDTYNNKKIYGSYTVASSNSQLGTITLESSFEYRDIWKGKISFADNSTPISNPPVSANIVSTPSYAAHTGINSLQLVGFMVAEQYKLNLTPGNSYVVSAWLQSQSPGDTITYQSPATTVATSKRGMYMLFYDINGNLITATQPATPVNMSNVIEPTGPVVEGWQRAEDYITVPMGTDRVVLVLNSGAFTTLWDDIRIYPLTGNIQTYVYNKQNYKVSAVLDNNNYATLYYYDDQGNLFLLKKETEKGIQTIQESFSHQRER
jgi:hypothetical protein